jgi:folate-binding protein YgfZ
VLRIEAGTPRWGADLDENVIPLEAGLRDKMISETKGCYTGQEVIIRILHRGHVNWMLRGALLGGAPPPERGTPLVSAEGKQVGRITSASVSPRHGQTIALCYARRELLLPAVVQLGETGFDAQVVTLPFARTEAGA